MMRLWVERGQAVVDDMVLASTRRPIAGTLYDYVYADDLRERINDEIRFWRRRNRKACLAAINCRRFLDEGLDDEE